MIAAAVAFPLAAALSVSAQVRDAPGANADTGVIAGTVVTDEESPRPVRRAIVTLNARDPLVGRTAITDDSGRFVFTKLPAARYTLSATKRGWVGGLYGAKAIGRPGRGLSLAHGERATPAIRMSRGAVISGTLLDQFGQPMSGVMLSVLKYAYTANTGQRRLVQTGASYSGPDERGRYRIYGLTPGQYYVAAVNGTASSGADSRDMHLTSDVDVQEALKAARDGPAALMTDVPQSNVGYAQILYPGVTSVAQATPIAVRASEECSGVDFTIQYSSVARVEGTIVSPTGAPMAARVWLVATDPGGSPSGAESRRNTEAGPDGRFAFAEVVPGAYMLSSKVVLPAVPDEPRLMLTGSSELDVQSNVSGVSLTLQEGLTVSGMIRYDGNAPAPDLTSLRVTLVSTQYTGVMGISLGTPTTTADGRFTLSTVDPGRYRVGMAVFSLQGPSWVMRSATLLGQEALDNGVDIRHSVNDAEITITDRRSELTGRIEGGAAADYTMLLFSTNQAHRTPLSRRILNTRPATDGSFAFRNVPPGDYHLVAADDVEPGEWYDPSFLQRMVPSAITVTIVEGENKVQNVKAGGG